ncbi:MAG: penicillin-binding protein 2, partial [Roseiflexus castenholzii]
MTDRLRARIDWFAGALGVLILGSGLFIASVMQWRLHLLAGLWLLSLPARRLIGRYRATADRSLRGLMVMAVLGFAAIGLQLARNQATQSEATLRAVASLAQPIFPETDPAERTSLGSGRAFPVVINAGMRGRIVDRNGVVLAETVDGRRTYPNPALGHLIGFQSRLYGTTGLEARFDAQLSGVATLSP